jgi:hypothetical protein
MTVRVGEMIAKNIYRILFFLMNAVFIFNSCATSKDTPCPDFRNNKSYSKKYIADYRSDKRQKNYYIKRSLDHGFYFYNRQKYSYSNLKDFTINPDKTYK